MSDGAKATARWIAPRRLAALLCVGRSPSNQLAPAGRMICSDHGGNTAASRVAAAILPISISVNIKIATDQRSDCRQSQGTDSARRAKGQRGTHRQISLPPQHQGPDKCGPYGRWTSRVCSVVALRPQCGAGHCPSNDRTCGGPTRAAGRRTVQLLGLSQGPAATRAPRSLRGTRVAMAQVHTTSHHSRIRSSQQRHHPRRPTRQRHPACRVATTTTTTRLPTPAPRACLWRCY